MKKRAILIALAALVPLAGCVAPYPYYGAYYGPSYGRSYYDRGYYGGGGYGYPNRPYRSARKVRVVE